jgi:hypothetical protein
MNITSFRLALSTISTNECISINLIEALFQLDHRIRSNKLALGEVYILIWIPLSLIVSQLTPRFATVCSDAHPEADALVNMSDEHD